MDPSVRFRKAVDPSTGIVVAFAIWILISPDLHASSPVSPAFGTEERIAIGNTNADGMDEGLVSGNPGTNDLACTAFYDQIRFMEERQSLSRIPHISKPHCPRFRPSTVPHLLTVPRSLYLLLT